MLGMTKLVGVLCFVIEGDNQHVLKLSNFSFAKAINIQGKQLYSRKSNVT